MARKPLGSLQRTSVCSKHHALAHIRRMKSVLAPSSCELSMAKFPLALHSGFNSNGKCDSGTLLADALSIPLPPEHLPRESCFRQF